MLLQATKTLSIPTAEVFEPLLQPARYKGIHGGRGGAKSHFFAEHMIEDSMLEPGLRGVCIREVQMSLKESVKRLLEDKIASLGVGPMFRVMEAEIRTPGDGVIIFQGMQNHTAESIKSLEGYDRAWVEEAQSMSQRSIDLLRPTIRKPKSQLWFSWNPDSDDDPVDLLLRGKNPPKSSIVLESNYYDNPWFPQVLREEMEYDKENDFEKYEHVWLGKYKTLSEALIFRHRVFVEDFEEPDRDLQTHMRYGADWGFAADPSALVRCWIDEPTMTLYVSHEAFGHGVEIDELAQLFDSVPDARKWPIKGDNSRPETISYMARQGFDITAAEKWSGSVEDGVAYLKGFRRIVVHPRCVNLIEEFRRYSYKIDRVTGKILPIIIDKWNHGIDALRYALDGYIQQGSFDLSSYIKAMS